MRFVNAIAVISAVGFSLGADWTAAQDDPGDDLEITMTLMPEGANVPDAVMRVLALPEFPEASQNDAEPRPGAESSANGLDIANQARADGRAFGEAAAAAAQDNRESFGRGTPPENPGPPDNVPGPPDSVPQPPDNIPGPPDNVPGPPDSVPGPP